MPRDILLLGPQGAGKGTQARRVAVEYELPHIATGDMLRTAISDRTPLGNEVEAVVNAGELVSDELMIALIRERLAQEDTRSGFVLDGYPRTTAQAEALDRLFGEIGRAFSVVFALQIPDSVAFDRLRLRAQVEGRADDTDEAIRRRLENYHRQTEPLIEYYRVRGNLVTIHGERSEGEVFAELQQALEQVAVA